MKERDKPNLDIFRKAVAELEDEGKFEGFPEEPEPTEPTAVDQKTDYLDEHILYVPGAEFTLNIDRQIPEKPLNLSFPSIDQEHSYPKYRETVSNLVRAAYSDSAQHLTYTASCRINDISQKFNLSNAWDMDSFKLLLDDENIQGVEFSIWVPTYINNRKGRSNVFDYLFIKESYTSAQIESISMSKNFASNFRPSLAEFLLQRNSDYSRCVTKDIKKDSETISNTIKEITANEFPN